MVPIRDGGALVRAHPWRQCGLGELQVDAGGDVANGDADTEVIDGVHGAVTHVRGEAVGLHGVRSHSRAPQR